MRNFIVLRCENYKMGSASSVLIEIEHNERYVNPDWNPDKKEQNVVLEHDADRDGKTFNRYVQEFREKNNIQGRMTTSGKERSQTNVLTQFVVSASPEFLNSLSRGEQTRYFKDAFNSLKEQYPTYHWTDVVIHYDEKTPHMHANALPLYHNKERDIMQFSTTETQKGKFHYRELQERTYRDLAKNWNISRGVEKSPAEHKSKKEWRALQDKEKELQKDRDELQRAQDAFKRDKDKYAPPPQKKTLLGAKYSRQDVEKVVGERDSAYAELDRVRDELSVWRDKAHTHAEERNKAEKSAKEEHERRLEEQDKRQELEHILEKIVADPDRAEEYRNKQHEQEHNKSIEREVI